MMDPIDIVGNRICDQVRIGHSAEGVCTFRRDLSDMTVAPAGDLTYTSDPVPQSITPVSLQSATWTNDSSVQDTMTFVVDKTTTSTFTWSLTEGLKVSAKFKAAIFEITAEVDFSATQTQSNSLMRHWGYSGGVPVPPNSTIDVTFIVNEGTYSIPFIAPVQVRGTCYIQVGDNRKFDWDIDQLLAWNWDPGTFLTNLQGVCSGVDGMNYQVKVAQKGGVSRIIDSSLQGKITMK